MTRNQFLDNKWLKAHLSEVKNKAGARYAPNLNVDLPIGDIFESISRTKKFYTSIREHYGKLFRKFKQMPSKYEEQEIQKLYKELHGEIKLLGNLLCEIKEFKTCKIPWENINTHAKKSNNLVWDLVGELRKEKEKTKSDQLEVQKQHQQGSPAERFNTDIHYLYEVQEELRYFESFSSNSNTKLSNAPFLLLTGLAGTGKTHLLCDVLENRINSSLPAILVFGEFFRDGENLLLQINKQLGLDDKSSFLKRLDDAGKKSKTRALLMIDALNETKSLSFWKDNLDLVVNKVKKYLHVALIISVRSGFESEVLTKEQEDYFIQEEHRGFRFREWEAVTKFFNEFNLPLPEIPLLMPEFQYPLFLLLLCKAFKSRVQENKKEKNTKQRQVFRGHEGATYIFEHFVKSVADKIADNFKLPKGRDKNGNYVIWDTIIEKCAATMVEQNNDKISEEKLNEIVKKEYPSINSRDFIKELERNSLLIKVPMYSTKEHKAEGFDYRFPFQKFSDHLIGRYIFKKFRESGRTPQQFFAKKTRLGKFIVLNRGIVEALSIQCPEQLQGEELVEVAPYFKKSYIAQEAFIESLIWRKPDAFTKDLKNTLKYINQNIVKTNRYDKLLNAFLSVAPIPEHPLNANFLNNHLLQISMAKRDCCWSTFLHYQYGKKEAVDRLIEWGWSEQDKSNLSDESIYLYSVTLIWFLTTPNRYLRDKATKALVALLTNRLNIVLELLNKFQNVDDLYITERLYAVAYGCVVRNKNDKQSLKNLALWVYENVFKNGNPPVHILLRDYAKGIIEVAIIQKIKISINEKKIRPPYNSSWPNNIPAAKKLKNNYYPEAFPKGETKERGYRGYISIWSSVMYDFGSSPADFGNYVLNSALKNLSGRMLKNNHVNREILFDKFKSKLSNKQKKILDKVFLVNSQYRLKLAIKEANTRSNEAEINTARAIADKEKNKAINEFKKSLNNKEVDFYETKIEPFLDGNGRIRDPLEEFDTGLAQRWVFNRVVQLGWKPKLHTEFDNSVTKYASRSAPHAERIGKKYQWIAYHEFLAMASDHFEFKEDSWKDKVGTYEGTWQLSVRDIDPSCILKEFPNKIPVDLPTFNNYKKNISYDAWDKKSLDSTWLKNTQDLPCPTKIIELTDDKSNNWFVLEGFVEWLDETPPEQEKYHFPTRSLWYMIKSYIVKQTDLNKVFNWAKQQDFWGRWMPESHELYNVYLGEYPWGKAFLYHNIPYFNHEGWTDGRKNKKIPAKILVTDDEYLSSGSSMDCSTNEAIKVKLLSKWLVDKMQLRQTYVDGRFFDKNNELLSFDSSVFHGNSPKVLLIRKEKLCKFLKEKGCSLFWTLLGEKNILGGEFSGQKTSGRLVINGAYTFNNKLKIIASTSSNFKS